MLGTALVALTALMAACSSGGPRLSDTAPTSTSTAPSTTLPSTTLPLTTLPLTTLAPDATDPSTTAVASAPGAEQVLVRGSVKIPSVVGIKDAPGFHDVFETSATLPSALAATKGATLIVRFRDLTRPTMTCSYEHPLSGCVTLDWSDFPERPKVPAGGAFEQRVSLPTSTGGLDLFLSQNQTLQPQGDPYEPG